MNIKNANDCPEWANNRCNCGYLKDCKHNQQPNTEDKREDLIRMLYVKLMGNKSPEAAFTLLDQYVREATLEQLNSAPGSSFLKGSTRDWVITQLQGDSTPAEVIDKLVYNILQLKVQLFHLTKYSQYPKHFAYVGGRGGGKTASVKGWDDATAEVVESLRSQSQMPDETKDEITKEIVSTGSVIYVQTGPSEFKIVPERDTMAVDCHYCGKAPYRVEFDGLYVCEPCRDYLLGRKMEGQQ